MRPHFDIIYHNQRVDLMNLLEQVQLIGHIVPHNRGFVSTFVSFLIWCTTHGYLPWDETLIIS